MFLKADGSNQCEYALEFKLWAQESPDARKLKWTGLMYASGIGFMSIYGDFTSTVSGFSTSNFFTSGYITGFYFRVPQLLGSYMYDHGKLEVSSFVKKQRVQERPSGF